MTEIKKITPKSRRNKTSLADVVPDIEKYWDYEKNHGTVPSDYARSSSEKVWTFCPVCGESVQRNARFTWSFDENGVGKINNCRTCGKRNTEIGKKSNLLTELCPDIRNYWNYDKNEHDPEYYTISSGKRIYMFCPGCGKELNRPVCDAVSRCSDGTYRVTGCLACIKKVRKETLKRGETSILKCCPDIMLFWDTEKNNIGPEELTIRSREKIYTKCPECGKTGYRTAFNTFIKKDDGTWSVTKCQHCAAKLANARKAMRQNGSLIKECPEIGEWWDASKNTIALESLTRGSHSKVYLTCPACHHEQHRDIHSFVAKHRDGSLLPVACPECGYSSKGNPDNNLLEVCPEMADWWNYDKNKPFLPEQFTAGSQFMAYLTCPECGMELYTGIHSLLETDENGKVTIRHNGRCRKFKAHKSDNNLVKCYPQVVEWWDYEKNNPHKPEDYTLYSPQSAYFKCPDCGLVIYRRIIDVFWTTLDGIPSLFRCSYCNNTKVFVGYNDLQTLCPELAKEWSEKNERSPQTVRRDTAVRALWKCPICNGEYYHAIGERRVGDDACPYCNDRRVLTGYNDLLAKNPELAEEWSENNESGPDEVRYNSRNTALWKCPTCHGEYSYIIGDRKTGDDACPYCSDRKILPGYNSFKVKHPDLMEEWCWVENIFIEVDPDQILDTDNQEVWWLCKLCGRKYPLSVKKRLMKQKRGHNPCPQCNGRRWRRIFNI